MATDKHLEALRAAIEADEARKVIALCGSLRGNERTIVTVLRPKRRYINIDVGDSGRYMVERETGQVYGIKAYGVIHRGYRYGTVEEFTASLLQRTATSAA